ncbi:MAG: hypothetical protein JXR46_00135, partial [Calditrichaceae bacterium]|nr:hypothetical protein [Calditrichaceae bacterium]
NPSSADDDTLILKKQSYPEILFDEYKFSCYIHFFRLQPVEVEAVFGQINNNRHFRGIMLRGLEKVL